jgi:hypothetical protein
MDRGSIQSEYIYAQYIFKWADNHNAYWSNIKQLIVAWACRRFDRSPNIYTSKLFLFLLYLILHECIQIYVKRGKTWNLCLSFKYENLSNSICKSVPIFIIAKHPRVWNNILNLNHLWNFHSTRWNWWRASFDITIYTSGMGAFLRCTNMHMLSLTTYMWF